MTLSVIKNEVQTKLGLQDLQALQFFIKVRIEELQREDAAKRRQQQYLHTLNCTTHENSRRL